MRGAHMERMLDELSAELHAANRSRESLATEVAGIRARMQAAFEEPAMPEAAEEPPPPHY